ncbi:MAG: hypothetical protein ABSF29_05590 [Tepidisphaeraceae bacterium]
MAPVPAGPEGAPAPDDDASVLAQKTRLYARDLSPLINNQDSSLPEAQPSIVQWGQGSQPAAPQAAPVAPAAAPATQPAVVDANAAARLAAAKVNSNNSNDDVPQILPESADHIPQTPDATGVNVPTDDFEKKLYQNVLDYPRDLGAQLDYELLRFTRDETTPDLATISGLTSEDREILSALLDGINNFRNTVRADSNQMLGQKIQPLVDMVDRLHQQAELAIPVVALCTRVDSFAVYRPVPSCRFPAGQDNEVIVYCEVANFTSTQNNQQMWETRLRQEMTLYTEGGMAVWPEKSNAEMFVDLAHSRRHDFFIARRVALPQALTIGRYLLKVTITDPQSSRIAEATTPIDIVAE